jgi:hypothetical protein
MNLNEERNGLKGNSETFPRRLLAEAHKFAKDLTQRRRDAEARSLDPISFRYTRCFDNNTINSK